MDHAEDGVCSDKSSKAGENGEKHARPSRFDAVAFDGKRAMDATQEELDSSAVWTLDTKADPVVPPLDPQAATGEGQVKIDGVAVKTEMFRGPFLYVHNEIVDGLVCGSNEYVHDYRP